MTAPFLRRSPTSRPASARAHHCQRLDIPGSVQHRLARRRDRGAGSVAGGDLRRPRCTRRRRHLPPLAGHVRPGVEGVEAGHRGLRQLAADVPPRRRRPGGVGVGDPLMSRDTIPESWLAHRMRIATAGRTPIGDTAWRLRCPGCAVEAQLITDLPGVIAAGHWHAHSCAALRALSWVECGQCGGRGEVWRMGYADAERPTPCHACLGRGMPASNPRGAA